MKYGKIIKGNVEINKNSADDFSEVEEITGSCNIYSNVKLPKLTTIGGSCNIYSNVKLPKLTTIGGYCDINSNVELPKLTTIGGSCDINSNVELPKLTTIGGSCNIYSNVEFKAPKLTTIGGSCYINSNVKLPKLTTIGGSCNIYSNVKFTASKNLKENNPNARSYCLQFTLNVFLKLGFVWADNILMKLLSKKTNKDSMTVYKTQALASTKTGYCIEVNGIYSHGDTIKQAKADLIYKISNRDTSQYKDLTLDSVVTKAEAIKMYRIITGACEAGTKHFVSGLTKTKAKYKVSELIKLTAGQYGNETFKNFFEGK